MRRTIILLTGLFLSIVALGSDSPKEYDDATKVAGLEGTWRLIGYERIGGQMPSVADDVYTFHSGSFTRKYRNRATSGGSYRIDTANQSPQIDLMWSSGPFKGEF